MKASQKAQKWQIYIYSTKFHLILPSFLLQNTKLSVDLETSMLRLPGRPNLEFTLGIGKASQWYIRTAKSKHA